MPTRLPTKSSVKPYVLRLPEALQQELERIAEQELRSVNAQIQLFVRQGLAEYLQHEKRQIREREEVAV